MNKVVILENRFEQLYGIYYNSSLIYFMTVLLTLHFHRYKKRFKKLYKT